MLPPNVPQAQLVIWSLAFLATPGLLYPIKFATGTLRAEASPESIAHALLLFRLFFITLTMTSIGLVALVIWDGVYPDRRDARILTPLPIPGRTLIGARLLALAALCGIFVVGINAIPTLLYAPTITHFGGAANQVRGLLAFVVANGLAGTFVFSALVTLQGIALNIGGKRATDRLSVAMQILFIAALLQMIFLLPRVATMLPADLASGAARAMPSVWFVGLYDVIGGRPAAGAPFLATLALAATAASVAGSILLFVMTHARLTKRALEAKEGSTRERRLLSLNRAGNLFASATTRAVFLFTLKSLSRSRSHRLLVAMYVGGATALVVSGLLPVVVRDGLAGFTTTDPGAALGAARHDVLDAHRPARRHVDPHRAESKLGLPPWRAGRSHGRARRHARGNDRRRRAAGVALRVCHCPDALGRVGRTRPYSDLFDDGLGAGRGPDDGRPQDAVHMYLLFPAIRGSERCGRCTSQDSSRTRTPRPPGRRASFIVR